MAKSKADIWMPLYIGDYLADTGHLSTEQHGAYLLLMFHYWRKGPLPNDDRILAQIARLSLDAWSIAQALLRPFFVLAEDGQLHQKRIDEELERSSAKKLSAKEKASKAAEIRWHKDAPSIPPSIPPSNASSTPQAMLGSCPSPSPSPSQSNKEQKQKTSRAERTSDSRHTPFRDALAGYWRYKNPDLSEMPWEGRDAKALAALLAASPDLTLEQFRLLLNNRAKSHCAHGDRVYLWIAKVTSYSEPLNQFNKPEVANGKAGNAGAAGRFNRNLENLKTAIGSSGDYAPRPADGQNMRILPAPGDEP